MMAPLICIDPPLCRRHGACWLAGLYQASDQRQITLPYAAARQT
jgi:hypothetical protein